MHLPDKLFIMKKSLLCVSLLFCYSISFAQETHASCSFLGFSADLRYAAMETYAEGSIEDEPAWTKFIFVDVDKNAYAANTISFKGKKEESIESVRKQARKMADPKLTSLNIKGTNSGTRIPLNVEQHDGADVLVFKYNGVTYETFLKTPETGEIMLGMFDKHKIDLTIRYKGKTQVLQWDKNVPSSRGFTVGYKFKDAYIADGRLAIIVEYSVAPGFEGVMDTYQMLVTGRLN